MKTATLTFICSLLIPTLSFSQAPSSLLPSAVKRALDRRFPGWRFVEVSAEIRDFLTREISADARPEIIKGDFDGNGKLDYAVLITHAGDRYVVAFLRKASGFRLHVVTNSDTADYLVLAKRGEKDYDHTNHKNFVYAHDTIMTAISEKAGMSYIYERGKFRAIISAD